MAVADTRDRKRSQTTATKSAVKRRKVLATDDFDRPGRTNQACDRCRLKKVKCDGSTPCERCAQADSVCQFGVQTSREGKSVSAGHINQLQAHNEILSTALRILWERHNNQEQTLFAQRRRAPPIHKICQEVGSLESRGSNQHSPVSVGLKQEAYSPSSGLSTNSPPSMPFDPLSSGSGSISTFGSPPPSLDNPPPLTTDNSPEASNSTQSSDYMPAPQSVFSGNGHDIQGSSPFGQPFEYEQKFSMPQQNFSTPAMGYAPDLKSMNGSAPGRGPLQYGPQYDFGHNPFDTQSKPFDMQSRPVDMQSKALDMKSEPLDIDDLMDMGMSSSCFDMPDWGLSLPN